MENIEGAPADNRYLETLGNQYELAPKVALMPMLRFAHLAKKGAGAEDMDALAAMYDLLRAVFTDEAWARFEVDASDARLESDDLLGVVQDAMTVISARPTGRPSVSSPGPARTTESSTESSSFAERKRALGLVPVMEGMAELAV